MAKRGEISAADKSKERTFKHSARIEDVEAMRARIEALGWGWHFAVADAGISRNVGFTLLQGKASTGSLRTVEAWVKKKEAEQSPASTPHERWSALGADLTQLGVEELDRVMDSLREYVSAEKRKRAAINELLRITPITPR